LRPVRRKKPVVGTRVDNPVGPYFFLLGFFRGSGPLWRGPSVVFVQPHFTSVPGPTPPGFVNPKNTVIFKTLFFFFFFFFFVFWPQNTGLEEPLFCFIFVSPTVGEQLQDVFLGRLFPVPLPSHFIFSWGRLFVGPGGPVNPSTV